MVSLLDPQVPFPGADLLTRQFNQEIFILVSWNLFLCVSQKGLILVLFPSFFCVPSGLCLQGTLWQDADDGSASRPWQRVVEAFVGSYGNDLKITWGGQGSGDLPSSKVNHKVMELGLCYNASVFFVSFIFSLWQHFKPVQTYQKVEKPFHDIRRFNCS